MKKCALRFLPVVLLIAPLVGVAQEPPGVGEALRNLTSERTNHTSFTFDHDMLQSATGFLETAKDLRSS